MAHKHITAYAVTFVVGGVGVAVFAVLQLPLPFLFGPLFSCLAAAFIGVPLKTVRWFSLSCRTVLGLAIGASITPDFLAAIPSLFTSLVFIPLYAVLILCLGMPYFYRLCKYDKTTAYYAAMPGGFQDMVIFGEAAGANVRALSLTHMTRAFVVITLLPIIATVFFDARLTHPIGNSIHAFTYDDIVIMILAALFGWILFKKLRVPGASILGPFFFASLLTATGFITQRPPKEIILFAQFFISVGIGAGFVGIKLYELRKYIIAGVVYASFLMAMALVFVQIVTYLGVAPPLEAFLAFTPGGQAEIIMLAIVMGADLGFIVAHHILRLVLVITLAPIVAKFIKNGNKTIL